MRFFGSIAVMAVASCATSSDGDPLNGGDALVAASPAPTFQNAVVRFDCPDPGVLADGGRYVMVCTGGSFRIRTSTDLVTWTDSEKSIFPEGKPPWAINGWRDWAPEIHRIAAGRYVAYYTAADANDRLAIGAAWASDPLGPYTDVGAPLVQHEIGVIDATHFTDDDGRQYLYWKVDGNQRAGGATPIMGRELAADGVSFAPRSSPVVVFDRATTWEGPLVEAPWIVKRNGQYFMFYSADVYDDRYKTGVARAAAPLATFTRKADPILVNNATWVGPGHGSIVEVGTTDWFVHHAWPTDGHGNMLREKGRYVLVDRVSWADGWPSFEANTSKVEAQRMP